MGTHLIQHPKRWLNTNHHRNVVACSDYNRLTLSIIADYFENTFERQPEQWAIQWFTITTGMEPNRVLNILLDEPLERLAHDNAILDTKNNKIHYLMNNRSDQPDCHDQRWRMILSLPSAFVVLLAKAIKNQHNLGSKLKRRAQYFSKSHAGPAPTLHRLQASSAIHIANKLDPIVAAWLSGSASRIQKGQIDYIKLTVEELNHQYQAAHSRLVIKLIERDGKRSNLISFLRSLKFPVVSESHTVGSNVYVDINRLREGFRLLNKSIKEQDNKRAYHPSWATLARSVELLNLLNLKLYFLLQTALGLRPVGKIVSISDSETRFGCMKRDKSTPEYKEFSLTALPETVVDFHKIHKDRLAVLESALASIGYRIVTYERKKTVRRGPLARYYSIDAPNKIIREHVMTGADAASLLREYSLDQYFPEINNALRHYAATIFFGLLTKPLRDVYLTHNMNGVYAYAKTSSFSVRALDTLSFAVNNLLASIGLIDHHEIQLQKTA